MKLNYILLAMLVGFSALTVSTVALALPFYQTTIEYYSTAAKTTEVGVYTRDCNGGLNGSGTQTVYFNEQSSTCVRGPLPFNDKL